MPMLPIVAQNEHWHERGASHNTTRTPFLGLGESAEICLHCASPLGSDCGFANLALKRVLDRGVSDTPRWRIETLACMCTHCDEAAGVLEADGCESANRRRRLLERHRFEKLDTLLGVDEPLSAQRAFEHNNVPVLELRRMLLDERAFPGLSVEAHYERVFCSFSGTVAWLSSNGAEQRELVTDLCGDRGDLERRFHLDWPEDVDLLDGRHWILAAAVVRVVCAMSLAEEVTMSLKFQYGTSVTAQWLVLMARMFADTHLDLHLLCDLFVRYNDEWIETPLMAYMLHTETGDAATPPMINEMIQFSALQLTYPHPIRCVYAGELIDATGAVSSSNLWTDVQQKAASQVASFVHVFLCKSANHRCIVEGTQIGLANGTSRPIQDFVDENVRGLHALAAPQVTGDAVSQISSKCTLGVQTGTKSCVRITLEDGRHVEVTEDHQMLRSDGSWIKAQDVVPGTTELVVSAFEFVPDTRCLQEQSFELNAGKHGILKMDTEENRERVLAFARLIGYALSDGWISSTDDRVCLALGSHLDAEVALTDANHFGGAWLRDRGNIFSVNLKTHASRAIRRLEGIVGGRRVGGDFPLPSFLFAENTPVSVVREFLAALFGGDGVCPRKSKSSTQDDAMEHVYLIHMSLVTNNHELVRYMQDIVKLLEKCGVDMEGHRIRTYDVYHNATKDGIKRLQTRLYLPDSLDFANKVGFRYCNQKQMRLRAACIWWSRHTAGINQRIAVLERTLELYEEGKSSAVANGKRRREQSLKECQQSAYDDFSAQHGIVAPEFMPKRATKNLCRHSIESNLRSSKSGTGFARNINKFDFLSDRGSIGWFDAETKYVSSRTAVSLPTLKLKVIDKQNIGERPVYDLTVPGPNAFFANGVAVHNCLLREFDVMLCREIGNYPIMIKFVLNLLETFQFGNYPGPRYRPLWRFRKLVRRTHHYDRFSVESWCAMCHKDSPTACPKCDGRKPTVRDAVHSEHWCDMCEFVRSVKMEIFLAVKEFFVYQIHSQRSVEALLVGESGWSEHCDIVALSCDDARRLMNRPCGSKDVKFYEIRRSTSEMLLHLELLHDVNKPSNRRLYKTYALYELFLGKLNRITGKLCIMKNWTGCQQPGDFLLAPLYRDSLVPHVAEHPKLRGILQCDIPLAHLGGVRWCDKYSLPQIDALAQFSAQSGDMITSALAMVGVSPAGMKIIQELHFNSDERDMPDNATEKVLRKLFLEYPVDFHILHYYFNSMRLYDQVRVRPLDAATAFAQGVALRQRYKIMPFQRIPVDCDEVYFCRHCRILYDSVVQPPANGSLAQRRAVYEAALEQDGDMLALVKGPAARGVPLAFYDAERGMLMCSRDCDSSNRKKFERTGMLDEPMWLEDNKRASSIRAVRESARPCRDEPLEKISLLGRVLELGGSLYTRCVVCASVCVFSDSTMTNVGPTCGRHFRIRPRGAFQNLQQFVSPLTQQVRSFSARMQFPVPEAIFMGNKTLRPTSAAAEKLGVVTTPVIDGEMFRFVQEELYRDTNGRGSIMQNVRVEADKTYYERRKRERESDAANEVSDKHLEREMVRQSTALFKEIGAILDGTLIICAYCGSRCEVNEEFTRLTVNNCDGVLVDYLWKEPIPHRDLADVWLCTNDFNRCLGLLRKNPVPLCSELYFSLTEKRQESLKRVMSRKFRK